MVRRPRAVLGARIAESGSRVAAALWRAGGISEARVAGRGGARAGEVAEAASAPFEPPGGGVPPAARVDRDDRPVAKAGRTVEGRRRQREAAPRRVLSQEETPSCGHSRSGGRLSTSMKSSAIAEVPSRPAGAATAR